MHMSDFLAVGNEYTCDGNHPHVPCMHAGKEPGKASALGRRELVAGLRRDVCPVWHGKVSGDPVG